MWTKHKTGFVYLLLCLGLVGCRWAPEPTATQSIAPTATTQPTPTTGTIIHALPVLNCTPGTQLPAYIVQAGDTLFNIATRAGMTVAEIQDANCIPPSSGVIAVGQRLFIRSLPAQPVSTQLANSVTPTASQFTLAPTIPSCVPRTDWPIYLVQAGDTLYSIATRTGTTVIQLQDANCIPRSSTVITVGQRLYVRSIPAQPSEATPPVITQPANTVIPPTQPPTPIPPTPTRVVTSTPASGHP